MDETEANALREALVQKTCAYDSMNESMHRSLLIVAHLHETNKELHDILGAHDDHVKTLTEALTQAETRASKLSNELLKKEKEFCELKIEAEARRQALMHPNISSSSSFTITSPPMVIQSLPGSPTNSDDGKDVLKRVGGRHRAMTTTKAFKRLLAGGQVQQHESNNNDEHNDVQSKKMEQNVVANRSIARVNSSSFRVRKVTDVNGVSDVSWRTSTDHSHSRLKFPQSENVINFSSGEYS